MSRFTSLIVPCYIQHGQQGASLVKKLNISSNWDLCQYCIVSEMINDAVYGVTFDKYPVGFQHVSKC